MLCTCPGSLSEAASLGTASESDLMLQECHHPTGCEPALDATLGSLEK